MIDILMTAKEILAPQAIRVPRARTMESLDPSESSSSAGSTAPRSCCSRRGQTARTRISPISATRATAATSSGWSPCENSEQRGAPIRPSCLVRRCYSWRSGDTPRCTRGPTRKALSSARARCCASSPGTCRKTGLLPLRSSAGVSGAPRRRSASGLETMHFAVQRVVVALRGLEVLVPAVAGHGLGERDDLVALVG